MFGSVSMQNFRCFDSAFVSLKNKRGSLKPNIFLFGENSSGKTSFLLTFAFLKRLTDGYLVNDVYNTRTDFRHEFNVDRFDMQEEFQKNYRKNSKENMVLEYEIILNQQLFHYTLVFNSSGRLLEETLTKRLNNQNNIIYEATPKDISFGRSMILVKDLPVLTAFHREHFGAYTMLSILSYITYHRHDMVFKSTLTDVVDFVTHLHILIENHYNEHDVFNFRWNCEASIISGEANNTLRKVLETSTPILNHLVQSIFPLVSDLHYTYTPYDGYWRYELTMIKKTSLGDVPVAAHELPSGLNRLLELSPSFLDMLLERTIIIDQFDLKLHQSPILNVIRNILPLLPGQSILTLDSLDTMNHLEPASIYVTNIEDLNFSVKTIEDISASQPNHNIRNRYEQGVYGKPLQPHHKMLYTYLRPFIELIDEIQSRGKF